MNYQRHYDALVERAKHRELAGYFERHHVVPKCLGGCDEPDNLVSLTPEEHFVAHQLLVKIHPHSKKLVFAAWAMTHGKFRSNKKFGWLRRRRSEAQKSVPLSAEAKEKISNAHKGRKLPTERVQALHAARKASVTTDETKRKLSAALSGKVKTEQHKAALSAARKNLVYTPELKEKLAANKGKKLNNAQYKAFVLANKGKPLSAEHKRKLQVPKGPQLPVVCPHCNKQGGQSLMRRWHFDNCKDAKNGPAI